MSEQEEQRPLTRRERRMRDLGETGAMDLSEIGDESGDAPQPTAPAARPATEADIEISPFHPDGTPRSRREMRQLREEALAALAPHEAADPLEHTASTSAVEEEIVAEPLEESDAANETDDPEVVTAEPASDEPDFDTLMSPPTEPFTVEELREAESSEQVPSVEPDPRDDQVSAAAAPGAESVESSAPLEQTEPDAPSKSKRRFPWQRSKQTDASGAEAAEVPAETLADEPVDAAPTSEPETRVETEAIEAELVDEDRAQAGSDAETTVLDAAPPVAPAEAPEDLPTAAPETAMLPTQSEADDAQEASLPADPSAAPAPGAETAASPHQRENYSFPDIAPPEEWRSVFDDPSGRQVPDQGESATRDGDFDDLISRAVAQEGSTSSTGTSALILPSMPEDTGGLTGPLGATGDLYVTGSLKLPKSIGETGGHSALHDSIEMDPITGDQVQHRDDSGEGPAPVSARHAVSARVDSGIPVVAKPTREKSKLPLVLSLTGGGLLIVVVGLGAWGASNGFFG
ncbi:hypothetical protein PQI23_06165 [Leucobacter sp. USCH14]|uniref:hypothetical protein n=1 Tax=Leucobacter sp. USCH14 TaxID=3024838 RepID=UPI0030A30EAD